MKPNLTTQDKVKVKMLSKRFTVVRGWLIEEFVKNEETIIHINHKVFDGTWNEALKECEKRPIFQYGYFIHKT